MEVSGSTREAVTVFRYLAAAERHTCGFQRWVVSRFSAD